MGGVPVGDRQDSVEGFGFPGDVLAAGGLDDRVPGVVGEQGQGDVDDLEEAVGVGDSCRVEDGCGEGQAGGGECDVCAGVVDVESVQGGGEQGKVGVGDNLELVDGDQQPAAGVVFGDLGGQPCEGFGQ